MPCLYREDLEAIEMIIKDELKPREYKFETKDYEFDNIGTIPKDIESSVDFHIQTYNPYISIDFNRFSASVYANDDDLNTIGALTKIIEILSKKERKLLYWSQKFAWVAPMLLIVPISTLGKIKSTSPWFLLGFSIPAVILWIVSFYLSVYKFSRINFTSYKDSPSFLKRNRDQIILLIIGAIIGGIITVLLRFLFKI